MAGERTRFLDGYKISHLRMLLLLLHLLFPDGVGGTGGATDSPFEGLYALGARRFELPHAFWRPSAHVRAMERARGGGGLGVRALPILALASLRRARGRLHVRTHAHTHTARADLVKET